MTGIGGVGDGTQVFELTLQELFGSGEDVRFNGLAGEAVVVGFVFGDAHFCLPGAELRRGPSRSEAEKAGSTWRKLLCRSRKAGTPWTRLHALRLTTRSDDGPRKVQGCVGEMYWGEAHEAKNNSPRACSQPMDSVDATRTRRTCT